MKKDTVKTNRWFTGNGPLFGLVISCGWLAGFAQWPDSQGQLHPDTPRFTAEQVLNNDMPGRKASPAVEAVVNTNGFAADRLYSVPPAGVHPRILFGPDDLPRIRQQFKDSPLAAARLDQMRKNVDLLLKSPDKWGGEIWQALVTGDVEKFETLWSDSRNPKCGELPVQYAPLVSTLIDQAFLALLDEDRVRGTKAAVAIATFARILRPQVEEVAKLPVAENFQLEVVSVMGAGAPVGFMYDFAQPFMTPEQVNEVRGLLVLATRGRYGLGMDLPPHWVNWNYIGVGLGFPLLALSIEGEPGYDPRIYKRGCDVARNYILYGNSENGVGREAIGYHTSGMAHAAMMNLAMANRGDNLFTLQRWRSMFETWLIYAMQPYGKEWASSGDLGTFPPNTLLVDTAQYFYPQNDRIRYVAQNTPADLRLNKTMESRYLQLLCPPDLEEKVPPIKNDYQYGSAFGLPDTLFDQQRGVLFTRTGWGRDELALQVNCRSDTTFHSHDHPDRGAFYLTSHGQAWSVSSMRMTEPKYLNQITIDGRGQGYFPPPGKWIEMNNTPLATFAVMDTKYCYDWQWQATVNLSTDEQFKREPWLEGSRETRSRLLSRLPRDVWERDPSPVVRDYYDGYMAGNPRMWLEEAGWVLRAPHYPVEKSFRTIGLVKGRHPYVLIADDIKKDDTEHLYQWRMQLPMQVEAYEINKNDILLGQVSSKRDKSYSAFIPYYKTGRPLPEKGQPMLLIRVLQANQPLFPSFQDNISVETIEFIKHDDTHQFAERSMGLGKRLVIPSRSVEPDYKILLFPHRSGDPLPKTVLSEDGKTLTVEWSDQKDVYQVKKDSIGRTLWDLQRE